MTRIVVFVVGLMLTALVAGCDESGDDGVAIEATGTVRGLAWLDLNGNGDLEASDALVENVRVELRQAPGSETAYTARTNAAGEFNLDPIPVGDYRLAVDTGSLGDSIQVLRVDSAATTVAANDTAVTFVALTYPSATTDSIRSAEPGRRFFVEGTVISAWNTFAEGTLHIRDRTGALAALRVRPTSVALGDSVRLIGSVSSRLGATVLKDVDVFLVATGIEAPYPDTVTTGTAATADGGELDAELVFTGAAVVQDTLRNSMGEAVLRVDDGSGPLEVVLDRDIPFFLDIPAGSSSVVGSTADVVGVLVPGPGSTWVLKPRSNLDIRLR